MNHIYKLIWCMASNCFIVVSELAKGNKKSISCTKKKSLLAAALISMLPVSTAFAVENEVPLNISGKNQQAVNTSKINNINLINNIAIEKKGNGKHALEAIIDNATSTGNISIENTGNLKTEGNHAFGIFAENKDIGDIKIDHSGNISTNGLASHGIYAKSDADGALQEINIDVKKSNITINDSLATNDNEIAYHIYAEQDNIKSGDVNINVNDSKLSGISGDYGSTAVYIKSKSDSGNLLATLNNTDILLDGFNADGVHLVNLSDTSAGDITIETNSGSIISKNSDGNVEYNYAIFGNQKGKNATGDIRITNNTTNITTGSKDNDNGRGAIGIHALFDSQTASGDIVIDNKGNINTLAKGDMNNGIYTNNAGIGNTLISNTGNITTDGTASSAIHLQQDNVQDKKDGANQISNSGKLETHGNYSSGITLINKNKGKILVNNEGDAEIKGSFSHGIYLDTQGGDIQVNSSKGSITTSGDTSHGIFVNNKSSADSALVINNSSNISTTGAKTGSNNSAAAIRVTQEGDGKINLTNSGNISTKGLEAKNIYINALGNSTVTVNNSGSLTSENSSAVGIYSQGNVLITNTGNISAKNKGDNKQEVSAHGIEGISRTGNVNIQHLAGDITVENNAKNQQSHGIVAWGGTNTDVARSADILIGSETNINATQGNSAVFLKTVKEGSVNISQGATVKGGSDAGVHFEIENSGTGNYVINNAGFISAKSDKAINVIGSEADSQLSLTNSGTLQGVVSSNNETALNLENTGSFLVRNKNNETKNVAISHFNNGTINNTGTIKLLAVDSINNNTTGEYVPHGTLSSAESGIVHGQLLGVKDFNHSGVLDLTGAGLSGNSFVISGGQVAGQNGNGTFTTNGGTLKMATTLNEGGQESRSDVLVVDNLRKGKDSTKIDLVITSGSKEIATKDNGIQLVKTLGTQDADAFELAGPVTYGRYEYLLYDEDASGVNDGYYLRNQLKKTNEETPNPNVGVYLGNQYAAANMFNQNILDRRDNVQAPDQTVWARLNYNQVKTDHIRDTQELQIDSILLQIGADFYRDEEKGRVAGAYVGYGYSDVENRSRLTGTKAEGDVKGMQLGAYYSWMPEKDNGPYVDVWGHIAHYNNKLKGQAQKNQDKKYDSYGFAVSTEGGYSFIVEENDINKWIFKPHLQLTYNYIDADDFTDHNNTRFSNNKGDGIQTRLGARFYGNKQQPKGLLPFVEANWLYNGMNNEVALNGDKESSDIGKNIGELKIGLQGNLNDSSSLFIHFNVQKGSHDYQQIGGQIGYNYNW